MSDILRDGTADWHNWMRDTMKIDPNDNRTIEIVWACIVRCQSDFEKKFCSECAKNTERPPELGHAVGVGLNELLAGNLPKGERHAWRTD